MGAPGAHRGLRRTRVTKKKAPSAWYNHLGVRSGVLGARLAGLSLVKFCLVQSHTRPILRYGRDPDLVRVLAAICPGLVALGAPMHHPAAPTGSPYTQDQMKAASSPNK